LEKLQVEIGACLDRLKLGKYGLGENGLSGVGSVLDKSIEPEDECFQPKQSLGKVGNRRLAKRKKKFRPSKVNNFQLGWARNNTSEPGASSSVTGSCIVLGQPPGGPSAVSELGLLGKAPSSTVLGLSSMVDSVLHVGQRQRAPMRKDMGSEGALDGGRVSGSLCVTGFGGFAGGSRADGADEDGNGLRGGCWMAAVGW
jgi:hypothetical protein